MCKNFEGQIQMYKYNCFWKHVILFMKSREQCNKVIANHSCAAVAQFEKQSMFFYSSLKITSPHVSWQSVSHFLLLRLSKSFCSELRSISAKQSYVYCKSGQLPCSTMQPRCFSHVLPFPFVLLPLLPCSPKLRSEVGGGGIQWCYWFIWHSYCINTEALRREMDEGLGLGWGGGAWGCGDCVIRRHAPSCICDITAAFLSTELEQLRPLSNSLSPVHPLWHILASLFSHLSGP